MFEFWRHIISNRVFILSSFFAPIKPQSTSTIGEVNIPPVRSYSVLRLILRLLRNGYVYIMKCTRFNFSIPANSSLRIDKKQFETIHA